MGLRGARCSVLGTRCSVRPNLRALPRTAYRVPSTEYRTPHSNCLLFAFGGSFFGLGFGLLAHISAEPFVLVRDGIQKQALGQVLLSLVVVHRIDDMLDLAYHVFEAAVEIPRERHLPGEGLEKRQQVAIELEIDARRGLDAAHLHPPTLFKAPSSSGRTSIKFCAPVIVSI